MVSFFFPLFRYIPFPRKISTSHPLKFSLPFPRYIIAEQTSNPPPPPPKSVCIISLRRTTTLSHSSPDDTTHSPAPSILWSNVEVSIGIVCANLLPLKKPLFQLCSSRRCRRRRRRPRIITGDRGLRTCFARAEGEGGREEGLLGAEDAAGVGGAVSMGEMHKTTEVGVRRAEEGDGGGWVGGRVC